MPSSPEQRRTINNKKKLKLDLVIPLLAIGGLYWFSVSFFLAKRSLPFVSRCDEARTLFSEILSLSPEEIDLILGTVNDDVDSKNHNDEEPKQSNTANSTITTNSRRKGCWLPRRIDSLVILVVDALRFDFARDHLPMSIGSRIQQQSQRINNQTMMASQLLQFVADPPTVTMQRLKGLTTGNLPTFADISGNFVRFTTHL